MIDHVAEFIFQQHDDAEYHGRGTDHRRANEHRFGGGFKGIARAVRFFEQILGVFKIRFEAEIIFDVVADTGAAFNLA